MNKYAVIMAGGVGSRFWPRSKGKLPKQLLNIFGENTLIQDTVKRLEDLVDYSNILIVTNKLQKDLILEQLPDFNPNNIIAEPFGKNTAAAIALSALMVQNRDEESIIVTLPADHIIKDKTKLHSVINNAFEFLDLNEGLVTIGMKPTRPETGYGYIQIDDDTDHKGVFKVINFAEKPNLDTAKRFLQSGDFLWNSGMFIWRTSTILNEIKLHLPDLHEGIVKIKKSIGADDFEDVLSQEYGQFKSISIDYGVMEKSQNVFLVKGDFSWSDVGSWEEVYRLSDKDQDGNAMLGKGYTERATNSYIFNPKKFTALIGVDNLIVIETEDALLICNRNDAQSVKNVVDYLKINKIEEYL